MTSNMHTISHARRQEFVSGLNQLYNSYIKPRKEKRKTYITAFGHFKKKLGLIDDDFLKTDYVIYPLLGFFTSFG